LIKKDKASYRQNIVSCTKHFSHIKRCVTVIIDKISKVALSAFLFDKKRCVAFPIDKISKVGPLKIFKVTASAFLVGKKMRRRSHRQTIQSCAAFLIDKKDTACFLLTKYPKITPSAFLID